MIGDLACTGAGLRGECDDFLSPDLSLIMKDDLSLLRLILESFIS